MSESSNRSTERANSIAYIGLPTDSSWTRSNLGRGRVSTNGDTTRRVASSESGPRKISSRRSGGIVRSSGGERSVGAFGRQHEHGFALEAAERVAQRTSRHRIDPLDVVDRDDDGRIGSEPAERVEHVLPASRSGRVLVTPTVVTSPNRSASPMDGPYSSSSVGRVTSVR